MVLGTAVAGLTCLADVTSANIVGYQSSTMEKAGTRGKYNLIALPFSAVAGGNMKLTEAMSGTNWYGNDDSTLADNLKVWDPSQQDYYTYYWWDDESHEYDGWYDALTGFNYFDDCAENKDGLECGWTAWYLSQSSEKAPTVTFAGAVEPSDDVQITIYGGYNLLANPFPTAFQPNADQPWWSESHTEPKLVDWNSPISNDDSTQADNLKVWDADKQDYTTYYYWEDDSHEYDGWYDALTGLNYFEDDPLRPASKNGIRGGEVFWYYSRAAKNTTKKITFLNPTK